MAYLKVSQGNESKKSEHILEVTRPTKLRKYAHDSQMKQALVIRKIETSVKGELKNIYFPYCYVQG